MDKKNAFEKIVEAQEMSAEKGSTNPNLSKMKFTIFEKSGGWHYRLHFKSRSNLGGLLPMVKSMMIKQR